MFRPRFTITNRINNALLEIERARGFLDAAKLKEDWVREMRSEALILEAHHSTHIEGTRLSLSQAQRILAGKDVEGVRPDDRQELLNYRDAMDLVSQYLDRKSLVTEDLIKDIHRALVRDVRGGSLEPGSYRRVQNYVVNSVTREIIYTPPPPEEVPGLMKELVQWLNTDTGISPVLVAGIAQHVFVDIHPFLDGNGRTARLLCTLVLYQNGYDFKRLFSLSEFYDKDRRGYYDAIQSVRENEIDMTTWLEYFVEGLRNQMNEVRDKGEVVIKKEIIREKVKKLELNERQIKAVMHVLDKGMITNREYVKINNTSRETAKRDLASLVDKGFFKALSKGRSLRYVIGSLIGS